MRRVHERYQFLVCVLQVVLISAKLEKYANGRSASKRRAQLI